MDVDRWKQISELAALAAEAPDAEAREELLRASPDLRTEVESLLRYLEDDSGPLDRPAPGSAAQHPYVGKQIGPYRVLRELGSGGMGVVLLARREEPGFDQNVALKLARISLRSEFFTRRFLEERQILSRLEHSNIARLLDGGVTSDGTPFLVMQYIEGSPLDRWCASQQADIRMRIGLVQKICGAVDHAHEHLVVHRDIKPGNILVKADGEPVLLDFGTARLLDNAAQSGMTATGMPMLTARYASPEQVRGLSGSTRSDVYSLGVILYELLTGRWPYEEEETNPPALLRAVVEMEPILPSRRCGSPQLRKLLEGDLDAILLKALDKQPENRYRTAGSLAEDLRRHLMSEPVMARRLTWRYRSGRFLLRNRWAAMAVALVTLSLAGATAYSVRQARIAEQERAKAVQVAMFLEQLLGASPKGGVSALASGGSNLKVVDVIESAAGRVGEEFRNSPDIEAGLRSTIGSALMALGSYEKAMPHVDRAVTLTSKAYGEDHASSIRARTARGRLRLLRGDYSGAQADFQVTLPWIQRNQPDDLSFQHSLMAEALLRQSDRKGARSHFEAALEAMKKKFGSQHVTTATMVNNLAVVTEEDGDSAAAEKLFAEAADVLRKLPGPPGNLVYPLIGLQRASFFRGDYHAAKALCEEAYGHALKTAGARHPNTTVAAMQLALVKAHLGDAESETLARSTAALQKEVLPASHLEVSRGLVVLGRVLILRGKASEAAPLLQEAYRIARSIYPKSNWRTAEAALFLGASLAMQGKRAEAEKEMDRGLGEMRESLPETHPRVAEAIRIRDRCLAAQVTGCS